MEMLSMKVLIGQTTVGHLAVHQDGKWSFEYSPSWQQKGFPLAPCLPFGVPCKSETVRNFFDNMLPENEQTLEHLTRTLQISKQNTFGLLRAIRHDLTGALYLATDPESFQANQFRPITEQELIHKLDNPLTDPVDIWDGRPRLSVAGVQQKINVLQLNGQWGLGEGQLCSTHLFKFDPTEHSEKPRYLVLNEYFSMQLAKQLGFAVADVALEQFGRHRVLVVKRFDRQLIQQDGGPVVQRRHLIDACQALGLPVLFKYERPYGDGRDVADFRPGVSLARLLSLTEYCQSPQFARADILNWVIFNLLIGNTDSHGKNYSFFVSRNGLAPTPWYDLLNVLVYKGDFNTNMAMGFDDVFDPENIHGFQMLSVAETFGVPVKQFISQIRMLCSRISEQLDTLGDGVVLNPAEHAFMEKYFNIIQTRCRYFLQEASGLPALQKALG